MNGIPFVITFWGAIISIVLLLAIPPAVLRGSWKRIFLSIPVSFFGIILPLSIFLLSAFDEPDWKGDCQFGAVDCFITGKLALTPLVLWGCAAFYVLQVLRTRHMACTWVRLGITQGAVVSVVCFAFGLPIYISKGDMGLMLIMLIPFYTAVWYTLVSVLSHRAARHERAEGLHRPSLKQRALTTLGALPFWTGSALWSQKIYEALPDVSPSCFVVSSAARGHGCVVGPFIDLKRRGAQRHVNTQLLAFWAFEALWQTRQPNSHKQFRRIYNRLGPRVAHQIRSPWVADLVYIALLPFEWFARAITTACNMGKR